VLRYQTVMSRENVDLGDVQVTDEDVKFERLELPPVEDDRDDSRERQLGLIEPERRQERVQEQAPDEEGDIEGMEEGGDDEEADR